MLLQQVVPCCAKVTSKSPDQVPWEDDAGLRTEILAIDVRKAECPVLSSKGGQKGLSENMIKA